MKNNIHTFVVLAYKESKFLEECVKSVLNQNIKTNVMIATSTPNDYISKIAKKYNLEIKVNEEKKGIGYDFDFIDEVCYLIKMHDTPISLDDIEKNYELTIKRYKIQYCDALAHHPDMLDKRKEYLGKVKKMLKM